MKKAKYFSRFGIRVVVLSLVIAGFGLKEIKFAEGQEYTVRQGHPRLYITPETLPTLRQRAETTHRSEYNITLNDANNNYNRPVGNVQNYEMYYHIVIYSLLYQLGEISGFSYTHTPAEYGNRAVALAEEYANRVLATSNLNEAWSSGGWLTYAFSIAYDWLYDILTLEQKVKLVNTLIAVRDRTAPEDRGDAIGIVQRSVPIAGLAFYGDGINDSKAQEYVDLFQPLWLEGILAAKELESKGDGGFGGGYRYSTIEMNYAAKMLDAWRRATGENLFSGSTWLRYYPYWLVYISQTRPTTVVSWEANTWKALKIADDTYMPFGGLDHMPGEATLGLLSAINNQLGETDLAGLTSWFIQNRVKVSSSGKYTPWQIIWWDKNIPASSPSQLNLPLTKKFSGIGEVIMRTGFDNQDDTLVAFIAQPFWIAPHSQPHQNSFIIEKRGSLALDSGVYEYDNTTHDWNYSRRTVAHNTITIYDPNEKFRYRSTNDGGQRIIGKANEVAEIQPRSEFDLGGIVRLEAVPQNYDYIMGDATRAYQSILYTDYGNSAKISNFTRQFIYLRPEIATGNDIFVVFDRVNSTNANFAKKWLLHMPFEPTINGNASAGACAGHTNYDGDTVVFDSTTHESKLFSKTLLPERHKIVKIGGPGHEFESANCDNWPISPSYNTYKDWMGAWRIEVQPTEAKMDDIFFHVLETADVSATEMTSTIQIDADNMVGAKVSDRIIMFSKTETKETGGLNEPIVYEVSGQGTSKHLICDLKPNTQFTITNTNLDTGKQASQESKVSSSQGTLYFETMLGSNHQISITPTGEPPVIRGDVNGDGLVNVVDVQLAVNQFLGITPQTQEADLNNDGVVNVIDVQQLVNIILSLAT